jgi:hypothetical protein
MRGSTAVPGLPVAGGPKTTLTPPAPIWYVFGSQAGSRARVNSLQFGVARFGVVGPKRATRHSVRIIPLTCPPSARTHTLTLASTRRLDGTRGEEAVVTGRGGFQG